jgi:DNA-directed RNA polymerase specialized sigma24 family protein
MDAWHALGVLWSLAAQVDPRRADQAWRELYDALTAGVPPAVTAVAQGQVAFFRRLQPGDPEFRADLFQEALVAAWEALETPEIQAAIRRYVYRRLYRYMKAAGWRKTRRGAWRRVELPYNPNGG